MRLPAAPENMTDMLRRRLGRQALWKSALFFTPPLLAAWYIVFFLYRFAWLTADSVVPAGAALLVAAAAFTAADFRARLPSKTAAARLMDEKSGGAERFITLATIEPAAGPAEFFSRLKLEAAELARRVDFKKDFPFRLERPIVDSLIAALVAIVLFQIVFQLAPALRAPALADRLAAVAKTLAQEPGNADLAAELSAAAAKLDNPALSEKERQAAAADILNKLEQRIAVEKAQGGDVSTLEEIANELGQAANKKQDSSGITLP